MENLSTTEKILSAAGELFASLGYHGTSLRALTVKAKVNLAAVNYHYKDKETLYRAIITTRMTRLNEERLSQLQNAERSSDGRPIPLDRLWDMYFRPIFELGVDRDRGGHHFIRVLGRSMVEPLPFVQAVLANEIHPVTARFAQAFRRHVPQLPPEEFMWRLSFLVGAMHHTLATLHQMKNLTNGICRNDDHEGALRRLIQHATLTLTARTGTAN